MNDGNTVPYYKTVDMTDPWDVHGNAISTTNSDATGYEHEVDGITVHTDRFWITRKLDLYAKWRKTIEGADGINVVYDDGAGTDAPTDTRQYLDQTEVIAGSASTAAADSVFSYWDVQKWDNDQSKFISSGAKVFPGGQFTIDIDNARKQLIPNTNPAEYIYSIQLKAVYELEEVHTPTFIVWFDNYTGDTVQVNGKVAGFNPDAHAELHINEAVDIPDAPTREKVRKPLEVMSSWNKY